MQRNSLVTAALAAVALVGATMSSATAAPADRAPQRSTVTQGLISPLSAAVKSNGTAYVAQNFIGQLIEKKPGKKPTVVFQAAGSDQGANEVGAVSVRNNVVTFAVSTVSGGGVVKQATKVNGTWKVTTVADVGAFEKSDNPDGEVSYGFQGISVECAAQIDPEVFGPATYTGIVETHPYATASDGTGTYLADAAGNSIVKVASNGTVSSVAVLPVVPVEVTAEIATAAGFPECTVGLTYNFEPVPTDVEIGQDGMLYVSSLPGGPEDGSTGANGAVYRVDPATGESTKLVGGLVSATGVAVAGNGDVYVSQMFVGQVSRVPAGTSEAVPFKQVALPSALEIVGDHLYATVNVLPSDDPNVPPNGKLVKWGL
jgi:hypothetical protein